jgi:hypothetical protein
LSTLNSPELYDLLALERGWGSTRHASWVAQQRAAALLSSSRIPP